MPYGNDLWYLGDFLQPDSPLIGPSAIRQALPVATLANRLIWWLVFTSPLTYIYAVDALPPGDDPRDVIALEFPVLLLVSLLIAGGTIYWRKRALVDPIRAGEIDLSTPEGLGRAFTPFMLNVALSSAIAIFGLALTIWSDISGYTLAFCTASMVLMYSHRPTAEDLQPPRSGDSRDPN